MRTKANRDALAAALMAASLALAIAPAARAQGAGAFDPASAVEVEVPAGKSQVIELPGPYVDVMVANPEIADVLPLSNRSIYVVGKLLGHSQVKTTQRYAHLSDATLHAAMDVAANAAVGLGLGHQRASA